MITFHCKNCGQKISVPEIQAGKKGKCPRCKGKVVAWQIEGAGPVKDHRERGEGKAHSVPSAVSGLGLKEQSRGETGAAKRLFANGFDVTGDDIQIMRTSATEKPAVRKLPWFLDVFLYPTSTSGLINLFIFWGLPIVLGIVQRLLPIPIVFGLMGLVVAAYMFYYLTECVRDSAMGGTRAPENVGTPPDMNEAIWQALEILGCAIVFWGPVLFYVLLTERTDAVYWALLGYGVFFFPMGLLAAIMFNSSAAFNPLLWIASIFSTFFPYCGLVLLTSGIGLGLRYMIRMPAQGDSLGRFGTFVSGVILLWILLYLLFVVGHLLGRFYWRYQKRLNWEV